VSRRTAPVVSAQRHSFGVKPGFDLVQPATARRAPAPGRARGMP